RSDRWHRPLAWPWPCFANSRRMRTPIVPQDERPLRRALPQSAESWLARLATRGSISIIASLRCESPALPMPPLTAPIRQNPLDTERVFMYDDRTGGGASIGRANIARRLERDVHRRREASRLRG